jgi:hypothetical protein
MALKTARHCGISQIWLGLRVRKVVMEAPFWPPVSEGLFGCLVFDAAAGCGDSGGVNYSLPPIGGIDLLLAVSDRLNPSKKH